jgi:hypothetical protein
MNGLDPIQLHLSALSIPSAAVLLLASSATIACLRTPAVRYTAAPLAFAGVIVLATGSPWFLDQFGRDPFLKPAQPFTWTSVNGRMQGELRTPFYASQMHVSPRGRAVIVSSMDVEDVAAQSKWHVGRPSGRIVSSDADDLVFVDDDHILGVHDGSGDRAVVRLASVETPDIALWSQPVPALWSSTLSYRSAGRTWQLRGMSEDGSLVQIEGQLGTPTLSERRWSGLANGTLPLMTAVSGSTALVVQTEYLPSFAQRTGLWRLALLLPAGRVQSRFSRMNNTANSEVQVTRFVSNCFSAPADTDRLLCSVFDGTRTRFAAIDPETADVTPVAWLDGQFTGSVMSATGWLSGWTRSQAVAVRPITREAIRMTSPGRERVTYLTASDHIFATLSHDESGSIVTVYALEETRRASLENR